MDGNGCTGNESTAHKGPGAGIVKDHIYLTDADGGQRTIAVNPALPPAMARSGLWKVDDFDLHKELYRGKTSLLYMATDRKSGMQVALKLYRKRKLSTLNRYQVEREIRIHIQLDHVNIIKLFVAFEDEKNVYMVQEFASGGDLFEDLKRHGGSIKEKYVVRDIILPFLNALEYLHGMGVIHRDIKPENILLTADKVIKIADFGLSICADQERPVTRAGTLDYMAPEVLVCPDKRRPEENKEKAVLAYTASVDAWAVGILCYELLVGYPPFENESRAATYEHIMYKEPKFPSWMTEEAKAFITTALVKNASQRPTVTELARQPLMLPYSSPAPLDQGPKRSLELPADRSPHPILAPSTPQAYSPPAAAASSPASPSSPARKLHELGAAEAGVPRPSSPSRLSARPPAVLVPEVSHQLAAHGLLDRLPEALVQASSSAPGIMSVSSYTKGSSTSLQMDEDASYPSIAAALVAPLDSPRPTSPSLLNVSHPSPGPCHSQLGSPNSASYSPLVSPTPAASSSTSHLGSKSRLGVNSLSGTGLSCHSTAPSGARGHSMGSTSTARVQPPPSPLAAEGPGAKDASHFYKPAPGVLSDDSSVPVARPGSLSGLPVSPLQAAMYNSNGGRPHMAMQRPTPTQLLEVGDADEQKPSSSKYGKLFAKMWGHGGSGKAGASSADIEAFRVQGSPGSSSGKHSAVGVLRAQPGHRNLKEELLADREQSIVVLDRNGSVIGAPTMTFKQPSAAALQALRANLASGAAALPTAADNRANLLTAKFYNDLNPVGRMTSEAVLLRHGIDRGVGRSFTGANSPTMKKMANAPLVSKIHDFVQNK
ncbi:kinase-like domain-containing protein [Haematococcus lacustris]